MAVEDKEKIDILLKEYDCLRQEILSRTNNRFLMMGLVATFLGFVLFTDNPVLEDHILGLSIRGLLLAGGGLVLLTVWLWLGYLIGTLAMHVSFIEQRVNELAGEKLLEWETRYGWGRWGRFSGVRKKRKPDKSNSADGKNRAAD